MSVLKPVTHPNPKVSVVIPTLPSNNYEPPETLLNQSFDYYEVIVIADANLNRCEARNKGMEIADGRIIAQTDDDCIPPRDWVKNIYSYFSENPELVLLESTLDKLRVSPRNYPGANLAYRKDLALNIGGFDLSLDGWRADTDFGWRMEDKYGSKRCRQDASLEVEHQGRLRTNVDRKNERKFRARHPKRYFTVLDHPHSLISERTGRVAALAYSIFPNTTEKLIRAFEGRIRKEPN